MAIETKDLWQSAYMLSEGGKLSAVRMEQRNGRREAVFVFDGFMVEDLARHFQSGQAVCHLGRLKSSMSHLKEMIFARIRE
jgi:hypothetical protein